MTPIRVARHSLTLTWRNLTKIKHSPDLLLDVVMLPIVFVLIFVFLFGTAIAGDWHSYLRYVLPGVAVQALMFGSLGTALALSNDIRTGLHDRLRSLPIGRSAPLIGQVLSELVKDCFSLAIVFALGLSLGFRTHAPFPSIAAALGLIMLFGLAMCWLAVLLGLISKNPATVQGLGTIVILPLTFGSNVFVPTGKLPGWLQAWVKINPVTQLSDAARGLLLGTPATHAIVLSVIWSLALIAVAAPIAVLRHRA